MRRIGAAPAGVFAGVVVVAHRGASAHAPENTFAAFDLALKAGADMVEVDLRLTADGRLVALHDPTLARTAGVEEEIAGLELAELEAIPPDVRPPRLGRVLRRYGRRTDLLLEIKDPTRLAVRRLLKTLRAGGHERRVTIQSFDLRALRWIRAAEPAVATAALVEVLPGSERRWLDRVVSLGASAVSLHLDLVRPELVAWAHERGLAVAAWTANDSDEVRRLVADGVDAVITDDPQLAREALAGAP